jgi:hypothetical protein
MKYILITKKGLIMKFYIKGIAELYKTLYGGALLDASKDNIVAKKQQLQNMIA